MRSSLKHKRSIKKLGMAIRRALQIRDRFYDPVEQFFVQGGKISYSSSYREQELHEDHLKYGDHIYLQHDATISYLGADGWVTTKVTAARIDVASGFQRECIFEVQPKRDYGVTKELKKKATQLGLTMDEAIKGDTLNLIDKNLAR